MKNLVPAIAMSLMLSAPMAAHAAEEAVAETAIPAAVTISEGDMLRDARGARLARVYSVADNGAAQIILAGKLVTVPVDTLSVVDGKLMTSLDKGEVYSLR